MGSLYFIIRAGIVLAILAVAMFWVGTLVGKFLWGGMERRAEEIEEENKQLKKERDSLSEPGVNPMIPGA